MADALHRRAFFLGDAMLGMNRFADIGDGNEFFQLHFAGLAVDIDLGGAHADFPEYRQFVVGDLRAGFTAADHFAARAFAETLLERFFERQPRLAAHQRAVDDLNLFRLHAHGLGARS